MTLDDGTSITLLGDERSDDCVECPECVAAMNPNDTSV